MQDFKRKKHRLDTRKRKLSTTPIITLPFTLPRTLPTRSLSAPVSPVSSPSVLSEKSSPQTPSPPITGAPPPTPSTPPHGIMISGFLIRHLEMGDYDKGYLRLLAQLTEVGEISIGPFILQLVKMHQNRNHRVWVIEDTYTKRLAASGTLIIEPKIIHGCARLAHIEDIVVDTQYRNQGIGSMLVQHLVKQAKDNDCYKVRLVCAAPMIHFYTKQSFHREGVEMVMRLEED